MKRRAEILNTLEQMVDSLYELGHADAQYFEEIIGETMDIVMEYDLWKIQHKTNVIKP